MARTGNEDVFALLHATESRQDSLGEAALVLLADGMGGSEAGEIAAGLAIQALKRFLLKQKAFALVAGGSIVDQPAFDLEASRQLIAGALQEANHQVYLAAQTGLGRRGMGCTAEVVYIHGRQAIIGHVGDSRTYHFRDGRLDLITRDQTLINRLVELGTLTASEAESHPRRSELHQAIGGGPTIEPAVYDVALQQGDWLIVCSDGLSNALFTGGIQLLLEEAGASAATVARRLVNRANALRASDNATVVVVRVV
jgi:protein phosphatase